MKNKIVNFTKNPFVQGSIFLTLSSFLVNLMNYLFHFVAGRTLGPSDYGEITTLYSYVAIASVPIAVVSTVLIQKISSINSDQNNYVKSLELFFWSLIKKWSFLAIPLVLFIPFTPRITNLTPTVAYLLVPMIIIGFIGTFYNSALQGLKLFLILSLFNISWSIIKLLSIVPAIFGIFHASGVSMFQFLLTLITLIFTIYLFNKILSQSNKNTQSNKIINKSLQNIIFNKQFIYTLISILSISVLSNIDIIFVKKFFSSETSGVYNSWNLFAKIILYIVGPILPVTFVFFSGKSKSQNKIMFLLIIGLVCFSIFSYFVYSIFGNILINVLFGNKFNSIVQYLGLASLFGSLYTLVNIFNNYYLAKNSKASLILAVLLPIYCLLLFIIPKTLTNIMYLNIYFTMGAVIIYGLYFIIPLLLRPRK